jgi:DNA repair exonuclease SbcCD ATPase subunit
MTKPNSRIIGLKVRNVKRLQAVDFQPDPDQAIVGVGGKNASGKTSLLDSIMYALAGTKSIPDDAIRKGAKKGEIEIELDDYTVKRIITQKGARLEIKGKDGKVYASPQNLLDEMTGSLTFDPLRFQRLGETAAGRREQAEIVKRLVGLDFRGLDDDRAKLYGQRQDVNRELKQATARLEATPHYSGVPKNEISLNDLSRALQAAMQQNRQNAESRHELVRLQEKIDETERRIEQLQQELAQRRAMLIQQQEVCEKLEDADEESLQGQMENAEQTNQKVRANKEREKLLLQQMDLQARSDKLTGEISDIDQQKQARLAEAKMPVPGLTFNEDGVEHEGIPFENCSSAEQLKISVAMGIAMNPKLRIMLIRDGSLLDEDSRQTLRLMAEQNDCQCWVEFVGSDEECAIVIEDGLAQEK